MAASSLNAVRVRLYFDYPPPAASDCRMCWVLVDLNKCRVVADLASVIREKFDFSRRTILNLFIEDCYLPPTESVYVVRDNDSIRVKVENQPPVNGIEASSKPEGLSQKANKRTREAEEENEGLRVKKKKKKAPTEGQEVDPQPVVVAAEEKKKKKKRKKLKEKNLPVKPAAAAAAAAAAPVKRTTPVRQPAVSKPTADKTAKKPAVPAATAAASRAAKPKAAPAPSSSETSDSSEEEPPKKAVVVTAPGRPGGAVTGAAKAGVAASSSWESSSDSSPGPKPAAKPVPKTTAPPTPAVTAVRAKPRSSSSSSGSDSDSDSTSRTRLANRRPGLGHQVPPLATGPGGGAVIGRGGANPRGTGRGSSPGAGRGSSPGTGRGVGRGDGRFPWRGGSPRGGQRGGHGRASRGAGNHVFYCHGDQNGPQQQQPQRHADDTLTNKAVVLQNPPESAPQPRRDYGSMPLLAAPPRVGQKIAFKLLELTENYTPEVSDYKEGKIIGIDQGTNQIELELLSSAPGPAGPGKFDLVYQTADGSEIVEYAVSRTSQLTERWDSLLEPRLILENNV